MRKEMKPHHYSTDKGTSKLGDDIPRQLIDGEITGDAKGNGYSGVEVRSTDTSNGIDSQCYRETPGQNNGEPAVIFRFCVLQDGTGHDPFTEYDEKHCANKFCQVWVHKKG